MSITLFSMTLILFLIIDPLGNIAAFERCLSSLKPKKKRAVVIRELLIALAAMIIFYLIGDFLLDVLMISESTVRLSAGTILFLVAIKILFPSSSSIRANVKAEKEPFMVPLAIPLIAGPSLLATIMIFSHVDPLAPILLSAIVLAWFAAFILLFFSSQIYSFLGENGLIACERLTGMILVLLAIQRFLEGIELFIVQYAS